MAEADAGSEAMAQIGMDPAADDIGNSAGNAFKPPRNPAKTRIGEGGGAIDCQPFCRLPEQRRFHAIAAAGVAWLGRSRIADEHKFGAEFQPIADKAYRERAAFNTRTKFCPACA